MDERVRRNFEEVEMVIFYKEKGKINFRAWGNSIYSQKIPEGVKIIKESDVPEWAIQKASLYLYLKDKHGTCIGDSYDEIYRCAFISAFDNTQKNLVASIEGTFVKITREGGPGMNEYDEAYIRRKSDEDLKKFGKHIYSQTRCFIVIDTREEWR